MPTNTRPEPNMGTPAWKARVGVLLGLLPVLAACSGTSGESGAATAAALPACPRVELLRDAAEATYFREGMGRDLTDIAVRVALPDFSASCTRGQGRVQVDISLLVVAEKGPAWAGTQADQAYFVALTDASGAPVSKQIFQTTVPLPAGKEKMVMAEDLAQIIPLAEGRNPGDYRILIGLQLTPDQIAYNRSQRGL